MKTLYRIYTDVNTGQQRKIKFIKKLEGWVRWMKGQYYSTAEQWALEDGYIVQIPRDAWPILQIKYEDVYETQ